MNPAMTFPVAEHFISINGEGPLAGELALFIRLRGCNLRSGYCETMWANSEDAPAVMMTAGEIHDLILASGIRNVTLTGGEPLLNEDRYDLVRYLAGDDRYHIEIETNGSRPVRALKALPHPPAITLDYKLPSSGMEKAMLTEDYDCLTREDTVKFVSGSISDLEKALEIIRRYQLTDRCHVYLSPVYGQIRPEEMVEFMKAHRLNGVRLQLQLHKFIWDPDQKGV